MTYSLASAWLSRLFGTDAMQTLLADPFWVWQALAIVVLLLLLLNLPAGDWVYGRKLSGNSEITTARTALEAEEVERLAPIVTIAAKIAESDQFKYHADRTKSAIDYAVKRHDWLEDQRSRMFQATTFLTTAVLTVIGWATRTSYFTDNPWSFLPPIFGLALIMGFCFVEYNRELDSDRPYRLISNIKTWWFRYNLPSRSRALGLARLTVDDLAAEVTKERQRFHERIVTTLDISEAFREDHEQIFILQTLQRYKSESLKRLRYIVGILMLFIISQVGIISASPWL